METRNKKIGVAVIFISVAVFFSLYLYSGQAGTNIDFTNTTELMKMVLLDFIPIIGLYVGLYLYGGKKIALQLGGGVAVLYLIAVVAGYLLHPYV